MLRQQLHCCTCVPFAAVLC